MALIKCKECGQQMSSGAAVCPHCGKRRTSATTKGCLWIIIVGVIFAVIAINTGTEHQSPAVATSPATSTPPPAEVPAPPSWMYSADTDSMTGKQSLSAVIESTNTVSFSFPYAGAQHALLAIRKHPRYGLDVIFTIERGQFGCSLDGCPILVRFDDGKPERFTGHEPEDHRTTSVFIAPASRFYSRLKKAKAIRIESSFYQEGQQVFTFDVAGFDEKQLSGN